MQLLFLEKASEDKQVESSETPKHKIFSENILKFWILGKSLATQGFGEIF
ncbi:MAG: hypothetical protein KGP29_02590 [Proteobacteria bacterium]|nr:hypothetical protein [Pseudomonadota bacterium]